MRLHRAPAAPATPAYEPEPGRVLRLASEGLNWQGAGVAALPARLERLGGGV